MIRGDFPAEWKVFSSSAKYLLHLNLELVALCSEQKWGGESKTQEVLTWSWKPHGCQGLHLAVGVGICPLEGTTNPSQGSGASSFPLKIHAAEMDSFLQLS